MSSSPAEHEPSRPWYQLEVSAAARATDLYERFRRPVYRYCRAQLRSTQEAEDALQNTFLRAFTALQDGVSPEFEVAWLYRIAHNVCLSRRLAAARRSRVESARNLDGLEHILHAPSLSVRTNSGD